MNGWWAEINCRVKLDSTSFFETAIERSSATEEARSFQLAGSCSKVGAFVEAAGMRR